MKKITITLLFVLITTASFCQLNKIKLKKKEALSPMSQEAIKAYGENGSPTMFYCKDCSAALTINPVTNKFTIVRDSSREVARVDSSGKLFVIDSLATIKVLLKSLGVNIKK